RVAGRGRFRYILSDRACGNPTGIMMADHGKPEYSTATGNDYAEHEASYENFLRLTKWTIISVIVVLVFLWTFVY
ncbi:MAG TPA: aa3-type cytochrome c oxidase subunit IV, partial [Xanthobacteraceae bacterium]|nr:aa3-type cytochrome c oxidase subunit IV [Xanthobacteraceae bacterium]